MVGSVARELLVGCRRGRRADCVCARASEKSGGGAACRSDSVAPKLLDGFVITHSKVTVAIGTDRTYRTFLGFIAKL